MDIPIIPTTNQRLQEVYLPAFHGSLPVYIRVKDILVPITSVNIEFIGNRTILVLENEDNL